MHAKLRCLSSLQHDEAELKHKLKLHAEVSQMWMPSWHPVVRELPAPMRKGHFLPTATPSQGHSHAFAFLCTYWLQVLGEDKGCCRGTCAGEDEVAHASQALHGERVCPQRYCQARHLAKAPCDQRGPAVAPKAQAVADAAPNRQNVLQGTPQLYS